MNNQDSQDFYEQIEPDVLAAMKKPRPTYWLALGISVTFSISQECLFGFIKYCKAWA